MTVLTEEKPCRNCGKLITVGEIAQVWYDGSAEHDKTIAAPLNGVPFRDLTSSCQPRFATQAEIQEEKTYLANVAKSSISRGTYKPKPSLHNCDVCDDLPTCECGINSFYPNYEDQEDMGVHTFTSKTSTN